MLHLNNSVFLFTGKKLFTCETAFNSFKTILDTLGGEGERFRAKELMEIVTVLPDKPSFRAECLPTTGKIKDKAKVLELLWCSP